MESTQSVVGEFTVLLEHEGLHRALAFLNGRTRHRYTGLYRFEPPMLRSVCLFDRENPSLHIGGDSPMQETYCSIVGQLERSFSTSDAAVDKRLATHPARTSIQAYCGSPIVNDGGTCIGSLCHFDVRPRLVPANEIPVLEVIARLLADACLTDGTAGARGTQRA